jgi:hypothetical protein
MEQLVSEESDAVKSVLESTVVGREAEHDNLAGADISTDQSAFEAKLEEGRHAAAAAEAAKKVECLCVHGTCREGESSCGRSCDSGWTGTYCDVPRSDSQTHVNKNKNRDYTKDGLYRPMQI